MRRRSRVRAPALRGRAWLGTGGRDVGADELRGRIVLLDFWTAGCVNCVRVLDELGVLEDRHGDALVVLGVHSPKFEHEARPEAVAAAVHRHDVRHPVLDDADRVTWDAYAARAWPTLVLVDPRGYVIAQASGEGHGPELSALVDELVAEYGAALRRGPLFAAGEGEESHLPDATGHEGGFPGTPGPGGGALRYPGKALRLPDGALLVSDTGHLERELRLTGAGTLRVSAAAAACDGDGVFAACHLYRQEWLVDVRPVTGGPAEIVLDLDG